MIRVKFLGEWHELDTLNGYYRLEDLGGPEPRDFVKATKPHRKYTVQCRRHVWVSQVKVYQYCCWADPEFAKVWHAAEEAMDADLARQVATGVIHK